MTTPAVDALWQDVLDLFIERFKQTHGPRVDIWSRYPYVTEEDDESTYSGGYDEMSTAFADVIAQYHGRQASLVYGDDPQLPFVGKHSWVRYGRYSIDWTARQFYNLEQPPNPAHADLPCPLIWEGEQHPIVPFSTIKVIPVTGPKDACQS